MMHPGRSVSDARDEDDLPVSATLARQVLDGISPYIKTAPACEPRCMADIAVIEKNEHGPLPWPRPEAEMLRYANKTGEGLLPWPGTEWVKGPGVHEESNEYDEGPGVHEANEYDEGRFRSNEYATQWRGNNKTRKQKMHVSRRLAHKAKKDSTQCRQADLNVKAQVKAKKDSIHTQCVQADLNVKQKAARDSIMCMLAVVGVSIVVPLMTLTAYYLVWMRLSVVT